MTDGWSVKGAPGKGPNEQLARDLATIALIAELAALTSGSPATATLAGLLALLLRAFLDLN